MFSRRSLIDTAVAGGAFVDCVDFGVGGGGGGGGDDVGDEDGVLDDTGGDPAVGRWVFFCDTVIRCCPVMF